MKKIFIILMLTVASFFPLKSAQAHFLSSDGNIGAILHVDPNDDPIAGSQASFFFEFKDTTNHFQPQNCDCTFEIDENGKNIYSQPLFQNNANPSLSNASVFYTFPQRDVYVIKVVGRPYTSNAFQTFTLSWNFRVDQIVNNQGAAGQNSNFFSTHVIHFVGLGVLLVFFIIYFIRKTLLSKKSLPKGGETKNDKEDNNPVY